MRKPGHPVLKAVQQPSRMEREILLIRGVPSSKLRTRLPVINANSSAMIEPTNVARTRYFSIMCFPLSSPHRGDFSFCSAEYYKKMYFSRQIFKLIFCTKHFLCDFSVFLHKNIFSFNGLQNPLFAAILQFAFILLQEICCS